MTDANQTPQTAESAAEQTVNQAVSESNAYTLIRQRLIEQSNTLIAQTQALNQAREQSFGLSEMHVDGRIRVRTENNCIARDMVQIGEHLLFGYNVFIGLKPETKVSDVFSLIHVEDTETGQASAEPLPLEGTFLDEARFKSDFEELYRYYKQTSLTELTHKDGKLLAAFQIGERREDIRVFRWQTDANGVPVEYIDNRGERDIEMPPRHDFAWHSVGREQLSEGSNPHLNVNNMLFVRAQNGELGIYCEDNTPQGKLLLSETLKERTQSLNDIDIQYGERAGFLLLKITPYREDARYYYYNLLTGILTREDLIGASCVALPEDHGIIFPGGYTLQSGEQKRFDARPHMRIKKHIRSPNGEDFLYIFYNPDKGIFGLYAYNLINKTLQNPIYGHGYALAANGRLTLFTAEESPTRTHPMQIWQTPYYSDEYADTRPIDDNPLSHIGNPELVRGISDLYSISRLIDKQTVSMTIYEHLRQSIIAVSDHHYWLTDPATCQHPAIAPLKATLDSLYQTSEAIIDEFEKIETIRQQSEQALNDAAQAQQNLLRTIHTRSHDHIGQYALSLSEIRHAQGKLITLGERRYIDQEKLAQLNQTLQTEQQSFASKAAQHLADNNAFAPFIADIEAASKQIEGANAVSLLAPIQAQLGETATQLDEISKLAQTLDITDANERTRIIDNLTQIYANLNQQRARLRQKKQNLGESENAAQFAAQINLLAQSTGNALNEADTPEACDSALSRLLIQLESLESLESQFGEQDAYLSAIFEKREDIQSTFEARRQQLLDARQRKAQQQSDAAERLLETISKRLQTFTDEDSLNSYLASDALIHKCRDIMAKLRDIHEIIRADDIEAKLKALQAQAIRSLRDKTELYDGDSIRLGPRHRFSVNQQAPELTLMPRGEHLTLHISGTQYFEPLEHPELDALRPYWEMNSPAESANLYRSEYLAYQLIAQAQAQQNELNLDRLAQLAQDPEALQQRIKQYAATHYEENYETGIHDHDSAQILQTLLPIISQAGNLSYAPQSRALAMLYWAENSDSAIADQARAADTIVDALQQTHAKEALIAELIPQLQAYADKHKITINSAETNASASFLAAVLGEAKGDIDITFPLSKYAQQLRTELPQNLSEEQWRDLQQTLSTRSIAARYHLASQWLQALCAQKQQDTHYLNEAAAALAVSGSLYLAPSAADLRYQTAPLLGEHSLLQNQRLSGYLDDFIQRNIHHRDIDQPAYHRYRELRQQLLIEARERLEMDKLQAQPLSSFVRNKLINEHYLPLIGDNLAKQIGTLGEGKRTDLMGLLLLISPPGYGKTTLMEYIANRLGLIFVKINCPSLGHDVTSLDPSQAPNSSAAQELMRLNLALEMGNNVMLYLDDIQHTNAEFLQKFISLCDGTRRIDGVWQGKAKTYDLRGRKFAIVMAGNPYTETGEAFHIPDMLANRADIYNLGEIIGNSAQAFAQSYLENALTSHQALAPLALRSKADLEQLIEHAAGKPLDNSRLDYPYSQAEINEIISLLQKMQVVRDTILRVNRAYIDSAAQEDRYRTEPPFRLQGSYRNMNKITEKLSTALSDSELEQLIDDHYQSEAQLLKDGSEANLLKLDELRGRLTAEQAQRWTDIKTTFQRLQSLGGSDNPMEKIVVQLKNLQTAIEMAIENMATTARIQEVKAQNKVDAIRAELQNIGEQLIQSSNQQALAQIAAPLQNLHTTLHTQIAQPLQNLQESLQAQITSTQISQALDSIATHLAHTVKYTPNLENTLVPLINRLETALKPFFVQLNRNLDAHYAVYYKLNHLSEQLESSEGKGNIQHKKLK